VEPRRVQPFSPTWYTVGVRSHHRVSEPNTKLETKERKKRKKRKKKGEKL